MDREVEEPDETCAGFLSPLIFAPKGRMFVDRGIWNVLRKIRGCDRLIAVI